MEEERRECVDCAFGRIGTCVNLYSVAYGEEYVDGDGCNLWEKAKSKEEEGVTNG